jgi:hypothetical protein
MSENEIARAKAAVWRAEHEQHVSGLIASDGPAYPPCGSDLMRPELWRPPHWRWLKLHDGRPEGFVAERRKHCDTPRLCFEFGDVEPVCGPCDDAAGEALRLKVSNK